MYIYLYELIPGDQEIIYQESEISGIMWMEAETMCRMAADNAFRHCLRMDEVEVVLKELRIRKRMQKQLDFLLLADREKEIGRQTYKTSLIKENDAEHAWHMALYVMLMAEHANVEVDRYRTMCMVLIHDIVEIYAGDTYAYDEAGKADQEERERAAADRLFAVLPDDQAVWMRGLWDEFEAQRTPEARFARTLDNFQPLLLNHATDGKSWVEHGVKKEQPYTRNANTHLGSERMWNYADSILREHILKKHLQ
jgi:putative hydrolase of HD superfamily